MKGVQLDPLHILIDLVHRGGPCFVLSLESGITEEGASGGRGE